MYVSHNGYLYHWNKSHTVNVFEGATEVDVFTLYPANGRKPTQLEVCDAIARRGDHLGLGVRK